MDWARAVAFRSSVSSFGDDSRLYRRAASFNRETILSRGKHTPRVTAQLSCHRAHKEQCSRFVPPRSLWPLWVNNSLQKGDRTMPHKTATRAEWLAARKELLK